MHTYPNLTVLAHPLIRHKLTLLRDKKTPTKDFRDLVGEIAMLMAYEVTKDLPTEPIRFETPLEAMTGERVSGKKLALSKAGHKALSAPPAETHGVRREIAPLIPRSSRRPASGSRRS